MWHGHQNDHRHQVRHQDSDGDHPLLDDAQLTTPLAGANSAMYAVAIAESAPIASPMSVRDDNSMKAFTVKADSSAPIA